MDNCVNINKNNNEAINDNNKQQLFDVIVELSNDYYEAFITIEFYNDEVVISRDDIINALNESNVTYGLKEDVIDKIVKNPKDINKVSVAVGEKHVNGIDGKIEYYFESDTKIKPKELENGRVNHKELNFIHQVKEGDILAKKTLPIQGNNGQTVTNRTIKARNGKYVDFIKGKNVTVSNDGIYLLAAENGRIKLEDGKISIIKVLEINENVGIATGNIRFEGKVIVKGNVESGYIVNSSDEVEIYGIVEGAEIIANNIVIHKGVHNDSKLISEGDITSNFMDNCYAECKGNIISNTIVHCNIKCMGKIIANQKKGLILGGNICARKGIIAKTIGSQIGSATRIKIGMDEKLLINIKNTKKEIKEIKLTLNKINQAIEVLNKKRDNYPKKQIYLSKYINNKEQCTLKLKTSKQNLRKLFSTIEDLKYSKISSNEIFPGTNVRLNNSHYIVKNILNNVTLSEEYGEITIAPNSKRS